MRRQPDAIFHTNNLTEPLTGREQFTYQNLMPILLKSVRLSTTGIEVGICAAIFCSNEGLYTSDSLAHIQKGNSSRFGGQRDEDKLQK